MSKASKPSKPSKASKKAPKDASNVKASTTSKTEAPKDARKVKATEAPEAPKGKSSKGYDPEEDGPLHKDHPLVDDLHALAKRFRDHAYHYSDNGAFIVHRILSAVRQAISKNQGEDLSKEKGVYYAARSLLRSYGDPMPDEDGKKHSVPFKSLAGRFRILRDLLARLIHGHDIALERTKAYETKVAAEKRIDELVAALKSKGFTTDNMDQLPPAIETELVELVVTKTRASQILEKEQSDFDTFAHVLARLRPGQNHTPIDHWRTPAKFEDNTRFVWSYLITHFPQIPSIRDARQNSDCDVKLGARIETYLRTLDERRAQKMAKSQKQGIEYSVDEVADELAYDILHEECKISGMTETEISKLLGFYIRH